MALTTAMIAADFAGMAELPFRETVVWEGRNITGDRGQVSAQFSNAENGYLNQYKYSVWLPVAGMTALPKTGKKITSGGVVRQIIGIGDFDGVIMRLDLGDPSQ
jgi:hypothetical protein